jgi:hypothetical protein
MNKFKNILKFGKKNLRRKKKRENSPKRFEAEYIDIWRRGSRNRRRKSILK